MPAAEPIRRRLRDEQGWIGGTSPLGAALVTSPPDRLPGLLEDLVDSSSRSDLDPVAQAPIVHAQFEIIHPFTDGKGRVGQVLVAWLLTRRLSLVAPPPVSIRFAADRAGYVAGLTLFRLGQHDRWVRWFADAAIGAGRSQRDLIGAVAAPVPIRSADNDPTRRAIQLFDAAAACSRWRIATAL